MKFAQYAKLAAWIALLSLFALGGMSGPLKEPLKVRFQLADGVCVDGELTLWDFDGIDGSFGRRLWTELKVDDVWSLHQRVMDLQSTGHWINLGRVLLLMVHAEKPASELAERALRRAERLDASVATAAAIKQVREEAAESDRKRTESQKAAEAARLTTIAPEGSNWPADPWPALTADEQKAAVLVMRADAERILQQAGMDFIPVETDHFLIYTDAPRTSAAKWVMQLEKMLPVAQRLLSPQADAAGGAAVNPVWGKIVVFVFKDQDRFRLVEAEAFQHLIPKATVGVCHSIGPKAYVNLQLNDDEELFAWTMMHESVHAFMHRWHTPRRLPAWANEGIAEYITSLTLRDSAIAKDRRKQALEFVRKGGNLNAVLDLSYAEQTWPGPQSIGLPVGGLLIELMAIDQPKRFMDWINAIKAGGDWQDALRETFGTSRMKLIEAFVQYYMVND